jgi:hypothetical protein
MPLVQMLYGLLITVQVVLDVIGLQMDVLVVDA